MRLRDRSHSGESAGNARLADLDRAGGGAVRYEKAEFVLRIALDMQALRQGVSLEEIRRNYSDTPLSRSTAERLRDAVRRVAPAQFRRANPGESPHRWKLGRGSILGLADLNAEELAALSTGVALMKRENLSAQMAIAERGLAKLRDLIPEGARARVETDLEALTEAEGIAMRPGPRPRIDAEIVTALRHAILAGRTIRVGYTYRGSGRQGWDILRPLGFLYGARHYLVAESERDGAWVPRNFALSNFSKVEELDEPFVRDPGFSLKAYAERSFGVFQEEPLDVTWKFSSTVAPDAREFLFHPSQTMEDQPDGSLIVRFRAGGRQEMAWHLHTWGDEVEVIENGSS